MAHYNNKLQSILDAHPMLATEIHKTLQVTYGMLLSHLQNIPTFKPLTKDNPLTNEEIAYIQDHYCHMLEELSPIFNGIDTDNLHSFIDQQCNY